MRQLIGILALVLAVPFIAVQSAVAQSSSPLGFLLEPFSPSTYQPSPYPPARDYGTQGQQAQQPYAGASRQAYQAPQYPAPGQNNAVPVYQNPPQASSGAQTYQQEAYQAPQQYQANPSYQYQAQQPNRQPAYAAPAQPYGGQQGYYGGQQGSYSGQQAYEAQRAPQQQPSRSSGGLFSWLGTPLGALTRDRERETSRRAEPQQASLQPAVNEEYLHRKIVSSPFSYEPGTIVIDTDQRFLYLTMEQGQALRYGVGVGRQGFEWNGTAVVGNKAEWPTWTPPAEMREREPWLPVSMEGGVENPLGARALYLHEGGKDTLYRIHGTNQPETIGQALSSGCIRMLNEDVMDLYQRVPVGTKVVVL